MTSTVVDTAVPVHDPAGEQDPARGLGDGGGADDLAVARPASRRHLHTPAALQALTRPGASFKHDPPSTRGAADRWRVVNHDDGGPAEVWLYDEIGFWGVSAEEFCRALAGIDASEILLRVNSPGGDVFDGTAMYNALVDHPATVTCRVEGLAASAASFIAQAADKVIMGRGAEMMIHDASGLCIGNAQDMGEMAAILDRVSDGIAGIYHDRAGGSATSWRATMRGEQWYTSDEAVTAGLADEVMAAPKKRTAEPAAARAGERPAAGWDLSVFRYAGRDAAPAPDAVAAVPELAPVRERIVASAVTTTAPGAVTYVAEAGPELDHPATGTVVEPAPAGAVPEPAGDAEPAPDLAAVVEPAAEPDGQADDEPDPVATQPEPQPEPVAASAGAFPAGRATTAEPAPTPVPELELDPWAALVQHLAPPRPATVDQQLAALREASR